MPADLPDTGPLLVVEGPTTCAAALTLGIASVGRSSARPAEDTELPALQQLVRGRHAVIVAENDQKADGRWPGRAGAEHTAARLLLHAASVRVVFPPPPHKDVRDLLRVVGIERARSALLLAVEAAEPVELRVVGAGGPR